MYEVIGYSTSSNCLGHPLAPDFKLTVIAGVQATHLCVQVRYTTPHGYLVGFCVINNENAAFNVGLHEEVQWRPCYNAFNPLPPKAG